MKYSELREKSAVELQDLGLKFRQELAALRIQARAGQLAKVAKLGSLRRDIARILTAVRMGGK